MMRSGAVICGAVLLCAGCTTSYRAPDSLLKAIEDGRISPCHIVFVFGGILYDLGRHWNYDLQDELAEAGRLGIAVTYYCDLFGVWFNYGTTGIAMHIDYGQGGLFTGGNLIGNDVVITWDSEFNAYKAAHFDPARKGYFHYCIHAHHYNSTANFSSGVAELPGDDFVVTLQTFLSDLNVANTIAHELGHNLLLRHGGFENLNFKPNYNSVMNYRYQFFGVDNDCNGADNGILDYSHGLNMPLDENALDEAAGICGAVPIDWSGNAVIDGGFVARNINCTFGAAVVCGFDGAGACYDLICSVLVDFNDWTGMVIPIPAGTDFAQQIIFCQDTPVR